MRLRFARVRRAGFLALVKRALRGTLIRPFHLPLPFLAAQTLFSVAFSIVSLRPLDTFYS
jgi:hypothetical protein